MILDKYSITSKKYYLSLPDNETSPRPTERYLSEKIVADAAGSTSSKSEGILDIKHS
jgi:hypothetical protein